VTDNDEEYKKLPASEKQAAKKYIRFTIRWKLNRTVPVLLNSKMVESIETTAPTRQVACVRPLLQLSPPRINSSPLIRNPQSQKTPVVDLTDEDTIPYVNQFDPYEPIEVINLEPDTAEEEQLEPLDPDLEYRENIQRIFITLDEYARNTFNTLDN